MSGLRFLSFITVPSWSQLRAVGSNVGQFIDAGGERRRKETRNLMINDDNRLVPFIAIPDSRKRLISVAIDSRSSFNKQILLVCQLNFNRSQCRGIHMEEIHFLEFRFVVFSHSTVMNDALLCVGTFFRLFFFVGRFLIKKVSADNFV